MNDVFILNNNYNINNYQKKRKKVLYLLQLL